MAEGIQIGGAYYLITADDQPLQEALARAASDTERFAILVQAAFERVDAQTKGAAAGVLAIASGFARAGGSMQEIGASLANVSKGGGLSQLSQVMEQMGVISLQTASATRQQAESTRAASSASTERLSALRAEAEALDRLRRLEERANRDVDIREAADRTPNQAGPLTGQPARGTALPQTERQAFAFEARFRRLLDAQQEREPIQSPLIQWVPNAQVRRRPITTYDEETGRPIESTEEYRAGRYTYTRAGAAEFGTAAGRYAAPEHIVEAERRSRLEAGDVAPETYRRQTDIYRAGEERNARDEARRAAAEERAEAKRAADEMRTEDRRAREEARAAGAPYSALASGRLTAPSGFTVPPEFRGRYEREGGGLGADLIATGEAPITSGAIAAAMRAADRRARRDAVIEGAPFSDVSTARLVAPRGFTVPGEFRGTYTRPRDDPRGAVGAPLAAARGGGGGGGGGEGEGEPGFFSRAFNFSPSNVLRGVAALAGIPLGISVIAGSARLINDAIRSIVEGQIQWEQSIKNISGLYGQAGQQVTALATALSQTPGYLGGQTETLGYIQQASVLNQRYGLPLGQNAQGSAAGAGSNAVSVEGLVALGGRIAYAAGLREDQQREQLQRQLVQTVLQGGNIPERGIYADQTSLARRLGGNEAGVAALPEPVRIRLTAALVEEQGNRYVQNAESEQRRLTQGLTDAAAATEAARARLETAVEAQHLGAAQGAPNVVTDIGSGAIFANGGTSLEVPTSGNVQAELDQQTQLAQRRADLDAAAASEEAARQAVSDFAAGLVDGTRAAASAAAAFAAFQASTEGATYRLISWTGRLEDSQSIAHLDTVFQATTQVAQRATGGVPTIAQTPEQIARTARSTAAAQAYEQYVAAPQAARAYDENDPAYRALVDRATQYKGAPGQRQEEAQNALDAIPRIQAANNQRALISAAQTDVDEASLTARNELTRIEIGQQERLLSRQQEITAARQQELQAQIALAPRLLEEAALQQQITVAARENLSLRLQAVQAEQALLPSRQQIARLELEISQQVDHQRQVQLEYATFEAQQGALGPTRQLQDTQYQIRLLGQRYAASIVNQMQGGPATVDAGETIQQIRDLALASIPQELAVTEAQAPVTAATRAQEDESARVTRAQEPAREQAAVIQDSTRAQEAAFLALQQQEEADRLAVEARTIPLQQQKQILDDQVYDLQHALDIAQTHSAEIQHQIELQNTEDAAAQAYWQLQLDGAQRYGTYLSDANTYANDLANNLTLSRDRTREAYDYLYAISQLQLNVPTIQSGPPPVTPPPAAPSGFQPGAPPPGTAPSEAPRAPVEGPVPVAQPPAIGPAPAPSPPPSVAPAATPATPEPASAPAQPTTTADEQPPVAEPEQQTQPAVAPPQRLGSTEPAPPADAVTPPASQVPPAQPTPPPTTDVPSLLPNPQAIGQQVVGAVSQVGQNVSNAVTGAVSSLFGGVFGQPQPAAQPAQPSTQPVTIPAPQAQPPTALPQDQTTVPASTRPATAALSPDLQRLQQAYLDSLNSDDPAGSLQELSNTVLGRSLSAEELRQFTDALPRQPGNTGDLAPTRPGAQDQYYHSAFIPANQDVDTLDFEPYQQAAAAGEPQPLSQDIPTVLTEMGRPDLAGRAQGQPLRNLDPVLSQLTDEQRAYVIRSQVVGNTEPPPAPAAPIVTQPVAQVESTPAYVDQRSTVFAASERVAPVQQTPPPAEITVTSPEPLLTGQAQVQQTHEAERVAGQAPQTYVDQRTTVFQTNPAAPGPALETPVTAREDQRPATGPDTAIAAVPATQVTQAAIDHARGVTPPATVPARQAAAPAAVSGSVQISGPLPLPVSIQEQAAAPALDNAVAEPAPQTNTTGDTAQPAEPATEPDQPAEPATPVVPRDIFPDRTPALSPLVPAEQASQPVPEEAQPTADAVGAWLQTLVPAIQSGVDQAAAAYTTAPIAPPPGGTTDQVAQRVGGVTAVTNNGAGVTFNGPVNINNADDIERIAQEIGDEAGRRAYESAKSAFIKALEGADPALSPSLPGVFG